jgi:hypothetical protein
VWGRNAYDPNYVPPGLLTTGAVNPLLAPGNTLPARQNLYNTAQQAQQLGFPQLWDHFNQLIGDLSARDNQNKGLLDLYSAFGNNMYQQMWDRNSLYGSLSKDVLGKLSDLMTQYQWTYWPQWSQTKRVNDLYGNYGNYLLNKNAQDRAIASWIANRYGLSDNARNIAQSDIWLQGLAEALKVFDAETQAVDNINKTFNTLTTDAFSKYKWVKDDYLKSLYDQNFWVQTQLSQWLLNLLANNEQLKNQYRIQSQFAPKTPWSAASTTKETYSNPVNRSDGTVLLTKTSDGKQYSYSAADAASFLNNWLIK